MSATPAHFPHMRTWPFMRRIMAYRPWPLVVYAVFHILFLTGRIVPGLIERAVFDNLSGAAPARVGLWTLLVLYGTVELARLSTSFGEIWGDITFRYITGALVRRNMVAAILRRPGAVPLPVSSGEALSRFRDDVDEVTDFPLWLPDQAGHILAAAVAIAIMAQINLRITLVVFVPLLAVLVASRVAWGRIHLYRRASRIAAGAVTGLLGEVFGAVQAVKVANASGDVVRHLYQLGETRRAAEVRERLFRELLDSVSETAVTFGIGLREPNKT